MINFDHITQEDIKQHNPNWAQYFDQPYIVSNIGRSGSGKTNSLFNVIGR